LFQDDDRDGSIIVIGRIFPGCRKMHHFCNIGGMIPDPLNIARNKQ
jgi:hypothetical protein